MSDYEIWLDSEKAKIFALKTTGIEGRYLEKKVIDHHTSNKKDHHGDPNTKRFFQELAERLKDAQQLLILGPGLAKNHFKTHLDDHHKGGLATKIIGMVDSDHPTDNQILAASREFFRTYDLFNNPIRPF